MAEIIQPISWAVISLSVSSALACGQLKWYQRIINATGQDLSPLTNSAVYHGGDFFASIIVATLAQACFEKWSDPIELFSYKEKVTLSSLAGLLAVGVAELANHPPFFDIIMGTPDIKDIPAGILGVGVYALISYLARWKSPSKKD